MKKINRSQLIDLINLDTKIPKGVIRAVFKSFISNFPTIMKNSNALYIDGIGEFNIDKEAPSKYTRHDRKYFSYTVSYKPSQVLIKTLNNNHDTTISL